MSHEAAPTERRSHWPMGRVRAAPLHERGHVCGGCCHGTRWCRGRRRRPRRPTHEECGKAQRRHAGAKDKSMGGATLSSAGAPLDTSRLSAARRPAQCAVQRRLTGSVHDRCGRRDDWHLERRTAEGGQRVEDNESEGGGHELGRRRRRRGGFRCACDTRPPIETMRERRCRRWCVVNIHLRRRGSLRHLWALSQEGSSGSGGELESTRDRSAQNALVVGHHRAPGCARDCVVVLNE